MCLDFCSEHTKTQILSVWLFVNDWSVQRPAGKGQEKKNTSPMWVYRPVQIVISCPSLIKMILIALVIHIQLCFSVGPATFK